MKNGERHQPWEPRPGRRHSACAHTSCLGFQKQRAGQATEPLGREVATGSPGVPHCGPVGLTTHLWETVLVSVSQRKRRRILPKTVKLTSKNFASTRFQVPHLVFDVYANVRADKPTCTPQRHVQAPKWQLTRTLGVLKHPHAEQLHSHVHTRRPRTPPDLLGFYVSCPRVVTCGEWLKPCTLC